MKFSNIQLFFLLVGASFVGGFMALSTYFLYINPQSAKNQRLASQTQPKNGKFPEAAEFKEATQKMRSAVVHIKLTKPRGRYKNVEDANQYEEGDEGEFGHFGSGSGVIISSDGYIVTNNHVVENAHTLEIILPDKRSFKGQIIGTDVATDLALLKIEGTDLPTARFAESDDLLEIGDWVLAIGNPFDLTASVTAGIVSGKGRKINLLRHDFANQKNALEAFIQTDAAINPGNSGGALINLKGELVGINTAIATHTGYYTGFSFAIPVGLVRKITADLKEYGETKRAILGVKLLEITGKLADHEKLKNLKGVFIDYVVENSSASLAGLRGGDVILTLDKKEVNSIPDFNAVVGLYSPGQEVQVTLLRKGKVEKLMVRLRDTIGKIPNKKREEIDEDGAHAFGADLTLPNETEMTKLKLKYGVKVRKIGEGKLKDIGIKAGFIITQIDSKAVYKPEDVKKILEESRIKNVTVTIEGYYWGEGKTYYALGW
jgi:Do/DeqQ family serine protease